MIVAGEASGDTHAAKLVRALREAEPDTKFEFFGAAGPKMRAEGVDPIVESDGLSVVGLVEIASSLQVFLGAFRSLKQAAVRRQPDVVILVDFPEFNLRLARALKRKGFRIVYYISPQLWAWRKYRLRSVKNSVDLMLAIMPFEKEWYERNGYERVEYVGSPLAREVQPTMDKAAFCKKHELDPNKPIVALLPGSRHKEIVRILPVMLAAASEIFSQNPEVQFTISVASDRNVLDVREILSATEHQGLRLANVRVIEAETYNALRSADTAAITSGTATLEAGIIGTPMVVVYKTSELNYRLFEPMIDVPHYGLINLIAGKRVAKELIQVEFTPRSLSDELMRLLDPTANAAMRSELKIAADKLGHGGASKRTAEAILRLIGQAAS